MQFFGTTRFKALNALKLPALTFANGSAQKNTFQVHFNVSKISFHWINIMNN